MSDVKRTAHRFNKYARSRFVFIECAVKAVKLDGDFDSDNDGRKVLRICSMHSTHFRHCRCCYSFVTISLSARQAYIERQYFPLLKCLAIQSNASGFP